MRFLTIILVALLSVVSAHAAELVWDPQTITSPLTVERSATRTGPFTVIATLPAGATRYILTPGDYGWYQIGSPAGPSNVVQFSLDLYTGTVTTRLDLVESNLSALASRVDAQPYASQITTLTARVAALETVPAPTPAPAPTSNFTITQIDADHVRLTCNGIGITTSGSGTSRTLECRH